MALVWYSTNPGALYLHALLCSYVGTHKPSYFCHSIDTYLQVAKGQWNTLTWLQGSVLLSWVGNPFWCTLHTLFLSSLFSLHCWTSLSNYSNILVHPLSCWFNLPEEYNPNYSLLTSETHCLLLHIPCPWLRGSHIFKCLSESDLFWALMVFYF